MLHNYVDTVPEKKAFETLSQSILEKKYCVITYYLLTLILVTYDIELRRIYSVAYNIQMCNSNIRTSVAQLFLNETN